MKPQGETNSTTLIEAIEPVVTTDMNDSLTQEFNTEEVHKALKQMHPKKSPGPDEGLSALIRKSIEFGLLRGVAACPKGPKISHLFFVDDSLIFYKANIEECSTLEEILDIYECSTGQQLNREKTSLFFSVETLLKRSKKPSKTVLELTSFCNMRHIWGCLLWWEDQSATHSEL
ncbi:hypothetical protein SO802_028227 [Lithocarpus litseifolius]|uniref:Reverse transcriptase n=1 Tax=Lithocarpus litseifolius TaxID=425828 RepID=A0AAW2BR61_9ROSI